MKYVWQKVLGMTGCVVAVLLLAHNLHAAEVYQVDQSHSRLGFDVKHLVISTVTGQFSDFQGEIVFDPNDLSASSVAVTAQAASIDTGNDKRDEHLKSPDFFDAGQYPELTFQSESISGAEGQYQITGDLTIHGVTKNITVPVAIAGPVQSPSGKPVIALDSNFTINRQEYGVSWNKALDNGGLVVSDEVNIQINLEATQ